MDAGDEAAIAEWLQEAGTLVEEFRRTKQLFPSNRVCDCCYRSMHVRSIDGGLSVCAISWSVGRATDEKQVKERGEKRG